jgi:hypothetical protein
MLSGLFQAVRVQKVQWRSARIEPLRNPGEFRTCLSEFIVCRANPGRKRTERMRRRVTLTKGISPIE